ncbi:hypothetical protein LY01_01930 [Nonlabens xylanidelens]|uniref:Uncharacterized protein n=1 Tax=Nonlabens xylanidelens TaxID=191564 RepID=A0A2S6ILR6_9FLAO|nr:hypothetical protein [Nonlabens xylanidelens]PPK95177.1 hypothetical protein LY01_01930 [Nonlabens xylanidelens]PQJ17699.1 hypothetical protein BST94_11710 [Nonlabens xylanidelens]
MLNMNAQVGIGTTNPAPGTVLHVDDGSGTEGVKLPDADIVDLNTIAPLPSGTEEGMMVYNTNTFTGQGYFYWNGFVWAPIQLFDNISAKFDFDESVDGDSTLDLNTTTEIDIELMNGVVFNDNATLFTPIPDPSGSVNSLRIQQNGRYRITVFISLEQQENTGSSAIQGRLKITDDSTTIPTIRYDGSLHRSTEMDRNGGNRDDDGTLYFTEVIEIYANEKISVACRGLEGIDLVSVNEHPERNSAFIIEKLR